MKIVCIGSGNVATHLVKALHKAGFPICQIISKTEEHARELALSVNAAWATDAGAIVNADIYLYSVSDSALEEMILRNPHTEGLHVHTAGSMPMSLFEGKKNNFGVLYPLQTFSKQKEVDFADVPLFVEANNDESRALLKEIAAQLSPKIYEASSEQRQQLHLAAVFACNFTNHLFAIADQILNEADLPFEVVRPLIQETLDKTVTLSPKESQTGPAARKDFNVMNKHLEKLANHPQWQEIYRILSESIQKQ